MNIGIIGCEDLGRTLGELWHRAGHRLFLATPDPDELQDFLNRLGPGVLAGDVRQAASFGEVVVICVPFHELRGLGEDLYNELLGKTVIATANPDPGDGAMTHEAEALRTGHGLLPGCNLVRAFTTLAPDVLTAEAHRGGDRAGIPVAGETREAVAVVASLVADAGFEPVIVGGLKDAKFFGVDTPVHNRVLTAAELRDAFGHPEPGPATFLQ